VSDGNTVLLVMRGLSVAIEMSRFFGDLVITPGCVGFEPKGAMNAAFNFAEPPSVRHTSDLVVVVSGRLLPPWLNTGVVLTDEEHLGTTTAVVQMPSWARRQLVDALHRGGFEVEHYRTLSSMGGQIGSLPELRRFRERHARPRNAPMSR
jgi:hypothetical protein